MQNQIEDRARRLGQYMIEYNATVRSAASRFGVSKSTVHKDLTERLRNVDLSLYERVKTVLERNKAERHLRGGLATKRKYKGSPDK